MIKFRPGDKVLWYQDNIRKHPTLILGSWVEEIKENGFLKVQNYTWLWDPKYCSRLRRVNEVQEDKR